MIWSRVISINETTTSRCVKPFSLKKPDRDAAADRTLRRAACCTAPAQNVRPCSFLGSHALEINHLDRLFLRRKVARGELHKRHTALRDVIGDEVRNFARKRLTLAVGGRL